MGMRHNTRSTNFDGRTFSRLRPGIAKTIPTLLKYNSFKLKYETRNYGGAFRHPWAHDVNHDSGMPSGLTAIAYVRLRQSLARGNNTHIRCPL